MSVQLRNGNIGEEERDEKKRKKKKVRFHVDHGKLLSFRTEYFSFQSPLLPSNEKSKMNFPTNQ